MSITCKPLIDDSKTEDKEANFTVCFCFGVFDLNIFESVEI